MLNPVLFAILFVICSPALLVADELSPEAARVEAWWLASVYRFDEAKATLASVEGIEKQELELLDKIETFAMSLFDLLVTRGKGATFKLKGGGVLKGKPVEFADRAVIVLHNKKTLPLPRLSWESVAILSKSAAKRKGPEADALCAVAYILGNVPNKAKGSLRRASGPLADAAKALLDSWSDMEEEFLARGLAGMVIDGDVETFRSDVEKLAAEYSDTDVYERLKDDMRAAIVPLLEQEGKIGAGLNALEDQDLGRNKRRLVYGFVGIEECADWELISFEEATVDLNSTIRSFMVRQANRMTEEAGAEPMDVEQKAAIEDDSIVLYPGAAIRHCLNFKGNLKVTCEVNRGYEGFPLPYLIAHGHEDHYMSSFYWQLLVGQKGGIVLEPQIDRKESFRLSGDAIGLTFTYKKSREETEASLVYEDEDCGTVSAEENDGGYLLVGAISASPVSIGKVSIEGEIDPESLASLAETRIRNEVERLLP